MRTSIPTSSRFEYRWSIFMCNKQWDFALIVHGIFLLPVIFVLTSRTHVLVLRNWGFCDWRVWGKCEFDRNYHSLDIQRMSSAFSMIVELFSTKLIIKTVINIIFKYQWCWGFPENFREFTGKLHGKFRNPLHPPPQEEIPTLENSSSRQHNK